MAIYKFSKGDMTLRVKVTGNDPYFEKADVLNSIGGAKAMIESYMPQHAEWLNYTELIGCIDAIEHGGKGMGRRRINPIYMTRVERLRNWIEWEIIPQLAAMVLG